jgi:MFS family permease
MTAATSSDVAWRTEVGVYGVGLFTTSISQIGSVIIPLYAYTMNPSPLMFGLVFAAMQVLPLMFSIHAGALMDRLGARRVMLVCTTVGAITPLLYPAAPWIWALVFLQLFLGLAESMGWLGAQTMIGQFMYGKTRYAGRLSFVIRIGQLAAGPMAGIAWDLAGPWGSFAMMSMWAFGGVLCALLLPPHPPDGAPPPVDHKGARLRGLLPSVGDYLTAFRLLAAPAVVLIVLLSALMHLGNALQGSFYVAWLREMGLTGTAIGLLGPAGAIGAALFSLLTARLHQHVPGFWIVLMSLWVGTILLCVTPLLGSYLLLQITMFTRQGALGLAQPLIITLALRGAGRANQGKAIGLRGTANRMAAIASPLAMGAIAEGIGLEASFYVVGAVVSIAMAAIAVYLWRWPEVAHVGED